MEKVENDSGSSKDVRTWTYREALGVFFLNEDKMIITLWEQGCEMHVL